MSLRILRMYFYWVLVDVKYVFLGIRFLTQDTVYVDYLFLLQFNKISGTLLWVR